MKLPLSTRIARKTLSGLPEPRFAVSWEPGLRVPMADGVELLADRYFPRSPEVADSRRPATPQRFPTLLMRSPYGRGFPWAALYGAAFAEQGIQVLIQSARGTAGSGGAIQPWRDDGPDGQATVAWLRGQDWFDGRLGLIGPSGMAYAEWALAADPPPELKAMVVHIPLHNPHGFFYRSGMFALEDALIATTAIETQHLGMRRFLGATLRLATRMKRITRAEAPVAAYAQVMGRSPTTLAGAAAHPDPADGYWQGADLLDVADGLRVPTLVISGWSDVALDQALQQYGRLPAGYRSLLVGPWTHTSAFQRGAGKVVAESVAWLRGHLDEAPPPKGHARVAVGGTDEWRELPAWPPAAVPVSWYPQSDGSLIPEPPPTDRGSRDAALAGTVSHDPADPTPSLGGNGLGQRAGIRDNTALERREDVLVFTSAPLTEAVEVIGDVAAEILVGSGAGAPSAALFVRLCDVDERGRSWNVCDGITSLTGAGASTAPPSGPTPELTAVTVAMSSTAHRFLPGHRIRVQISGGAHPRYAAGHEAFRVAIRSGSAIVLPVA
jgi:putative CocE/NonD family hydrolase